MAGFLGIGTRIHSESIDEAEIKAITAVADAVGHALARLDAGLIAGYTDQQRGAPNARADTPTNLPQQLTPLIGRRNELGHIRRLLGDSRLITLKGTGGIGKTRLAIQCGYNLVEEFGGGVWFVDLGVVRDPAVVASAALIAVKQPSQPNQTALESLAGFTSAAWLPDGRMSTTQANVSASPSTSLEPVPDKVTVVPTATV